MIPDAAKDKAIEGGWKHSPGSYHDDYRTALDRSFWQCLGKAFKFDQPIWDCHNLPQYKDARCENTTFCEYAGWKSIEQESVRFCEIILTGGDTEAYWKEILGV